MANIINSTFSGQVTLKSTKILYTADDDDDIIIGVWSDFGNSTFNYTTGMTDAGPAPSTSYNEANVINNTTNSTATFGQASPANWLNLEFNDYRFRPTDIVVYAAANVASGGPYDIEFNCYNDSSGATSSYVETLSAVVPNNLVYGYYRITNLAEKVFHDCNGIGVRLPATTIRVARFYIYGEVFHEDFDDLPPVGAATTIEAFSDSLVGQDSDTEGILYKRNLLAVRPYRPLVGGVQSFTAGGTVQFSDEHPYNISLINPGGAARQVNLAVTPPRHHQVRIINTDGAFALNIYEGDGTTFIQELSNSSGALILDVAWDGTQWITTAL